MRSNVHRCLDLSRFDSIWGPPGPSASKLTKCPDCLDSIRHRSRAAPRTYGGDFGRFCLDVSICLDRDAAETKRDVETQGGSQAARGPKSN